MDWANDLSIGFIIPYQGIKSFARCKENRFWMRFVGVLKDEIDLLLLNLLNFEGTIDEVKSHEKQLSIKELS
ncbi:MAG: hypothetical protein FJX80_12070 [Bacteroidetes bacterium]|nr:hypothetical protein [Bacteroidota bacterium]